MVSFLKRWSNPIHVSLYHIIGHKNDEIFYEREVTF